MGISGFLFDTLPSIFQQLIDNMALVVESLSRPATSVVDDAVASLRDSNTLGLIGDAIADFIETGFYDVLNVMGITDTTILGLMVGAGVLFYISYQLLTWIANIIT